MVNFGEVVVFRGQPEDGRMGMTGRRCLVNAGHGCGCLEGRKERPSEETHLLAGHHCSRAFAQRIKRSGGSRRR